MATIQDVIGEVISLCGNRTDLDSIAASAVQQAITAMWNKHQRYFGAAMVDVTLDMSTMVENEAVFSVTNMEGISAVSYKLDGTFKPLDLLPHTEGLALEADVYEYPTGFYSLANQVRLVPRFSTDIVVRVMGVKGYEYQATSATFPLGPSLRPAVLEIALGIIKTQLGEAEIAVALAALGNALGGLDIGPEAKSQTFRDNGLKMKF